MRALGELEVEGVPTTRGLALDILRSPEFGSGEYSTGYLAEMEERLPALARHEARRHVVDGARGRDQDPGRALAALVVAAAERVDGARVRRPRRGLEVSSRTGARASSSSSRRATATVLPELGAGGAAERRRGARSDRPA